MNCPPPCNAKLQCVDSRQAGIYRRRKYICENCGATHTSKEAIVIKMPPPKDMK